MSSPTVFRKIFFVLLSFTSVLVLHSRLLQAESTGSAAGGPRVFFEEETYDFGSVMQGTAVEREFKIANHGDAPLTIQNVQAACGCTVASYSTQPLAPGDSSAIKATFDTSGFQGPRSKTLRVFTNDPTRPSATLTFKGVVSRDVELSPSRLYFGTVKQGDTVSVAAKLSVDRTAGIDIVNVESRSEHLEVTLETSADERIKTLHATLKPTAKIGTFRDRVVVKTTSAKNPVINVPVFARIEGDLRFVPSDVSFGLLEGPLKEDVKETVLLKNTSNKEIKVESVSTNNSAISAAVEKQNGRDFVMVVAIARGSSGVIKGQVTVSTDHPDRDQRELNLPVYGIISRKGS